ncbi:kinetochore protein Spc24 isoform X2 [Polypterus senegalus]|nr:kinetochore protein Spc24 isoform X2 [Polypterus senegalus]XP_039628627.1 kinetochore protein Spc24 isoform X2 [Polypterus senegalus]XP_039628628.1 kinetochore protein Spc24 isoform X2 [Polypterus senegalus]XP_039628629.1 kinetochore protein Spc24 isoform X2 [Polypterus senegalus]
MGEDIKTLEEVHRLLVDLISRGFPGNDLIPLIETDIETHTIYQNNEKSLVQIIKEFNQFQETKAQKSLAAEDERQKKQHELRSIERSLQEFQAQHLALNSEVEDFYKELQSLEREEQELQQQQDAVSEDTTVVLPSSKYLAQIYQKISKIKWDVSTEGPVQKGIHYGEIAQPITLDTSKLSDISTTNSVWGLISTDW